MSQLNKQTPPYGLNEVACRWKIMSCTGDCWTPGGITIPEWQLSLPPILLCWFFAKTSGSHSDPPNKNQNMTITSSSNAVLSACSTTFSRYCICSSESLPFMHLIIKRVCNQTCRSCCYFVLPRHMKKSTTHGTVGKGPLYSASLTRQKRVKIVINHRIIKPWKIIYESKPCGSMRRLNITLTKDLPACLLSELKRAPHNRLEDGGKGGGSH